MPLTPTTTPTGEEPPSRTGDDACPGALRLHRADDGFLARVRLPGGLLTASQATELALAAQELGDGALDLTSRGNVQLRGLGAACGGELADRLRAAGLLPSASHERVRNVALSPLSGLDGGGRVDVTPWVRELDHLLCAAPDAAGLSGRFLFAVDDGRGDVAALGADVTLIATAPGDALLRVATGHPAPPAGAAVPDPVLLRIAAVDAPRAALTAALAFLAAARASDAKAWRSWELPGGPERYALFARELDAALAAAGIAARPWPHDGRPPHVMPAGFAAPLPGLVPAPDGGRTALSVAAPLGRFAGAQWHLLADAARAGAGTLRVTPWRGVVVPGLTPAAAAARLAELAGTGVLADAGSAGYGVGACTGRPGCAKSLADVRADAADTIARASTRASLPAARGTGPARTDRPAPLLPVYWSGCERRCGHPQGRWVDVLAGVDGYRVTVTGTEHTARTASDTAEQRAGKAPTAERETGTDTRSGPGPEAEAGPAPAGAAGRAEHAGRPAPSYQQPPDLPVAPEELAGVLAAARTVP
ncbi:hypothetical protein ACMA1D_20640 [Streptomyces sp. 796.1]|uniref:hypothetical protein n=1 Tax=Streptomyces sp. 796.1 TaxID=3163029 RepID=UPI0039C8DF44